MWKTLQPGRSVILAELQKSATNLPPECDIIISASLRVEIPVKNHSRKRQAVATFPPAFFFATEKAVDRAASLFLIHFASKCAGKSYKRD